jgi:hypothetical protein
VRRCHCASSGNSSGGSGQRVASAPSLRWHLHSIPELHCQRPTPHTPHPTHAPPSLQRRDWGDRRRQGCCNRLCASAGGALETSGALIPLHQWHTDPPASLCIPGLPRLLQAWPGWRRGKLCWGLWSSGTLCRSPALIPLVFSSPFCSHLFTLHSTVGAGFHNCRQNTL